MAKILLLEDDKEVGSGVVTYLKQEGHTVEWLKCGQQGGDHLLVADYDLGVFDWNLPGRTGVELCREIRDRGNLMPVIMLTGKHEIEAKEAALDWGADDYLTKPFQMRELSARIRACLRRSAGLASQELQTGNLCLDLRTQKVSRAGKTIELLPREFAVLEFLMRHKGQSFTSEVLLNRVWMSDSESTPDAVRQCIRRLRAKIDEPGQPSLINHVANLGYKVDD